MSDDNLSPQDVCDLVPGVTLELLKQLRYKRQGPAFSKPSYKTVVYRRQDIDSWLERTRVRTKQP